MGPQRNFLLLGSQIQPTAATTLSGEQTDTHTHTSCRYEVQSNSPLYFSSPQRLSVSVRLSASNGHHRSVPPPLPFPSSFLFSLQFPAAAAAARTLKTTSWPRPRPRPRPRHCEAAVNSSLPALVFQSPSNVTLSAASFP